VQNMLHAASLYVRFLLFIWYVVIVNTVIESHADKVFSASFSIPLLEASPSLSL